MGKLEDLAQLDRSIRDATIRYNTLSVCADGLRRELTQLELLEVTLMENIECLKQQKIVAIASEYKKALADLAKCRTQMTVLKSNLAQQNKAKAESDTLLTRLQAEQDKLNNDRVVLYGNFGRKDG